MVHRICGPSRLCNGWASLASASLGSPVKRGAKKGALALRSAAAAVSGLPYTGRVTQTSLPGPRGLACAGIASVTQQERGREGAS